MLFLYTVIAVLPEGLLRGGGTSEGVVAGGVVRVGLVGESVSRLGRIVIGFTVGFNGSFGNILYRENWLIRRNAYLHSICRL